MSQEIGLRPLLMGPPLCGRDGCDETVSTIRAHLRGMCDLLPNIYGDTPASKQAKREIGEIAELKDSGAAELACMRALLLYALFKEKEVKRHFVEQEAAVGTTFAKDMAERVLPLLLPCFIRHSCQAPEAFVMSCLLMSELWAGETLGNWKARLPQ